MCRDIFLNNVPAKAYIAVVATRGPGMITALLFPPQNRPIISCTHRTARTRDEDKCSGGQGLTLDCTVCVGRVGAAAGSRNI